MKKYILIILSLVLICSCEKEVIEVPTEATLLSEESYTVKSVGGQIQVEFETNYSWTAELVAGTKWCEIDDYSGPAGAATFNIDIEENEGDYRAGMLVITTREKRLEVLIEQDEQTVVELQTDEDNSTHSIGGDVVIKVLTNKPWSVEVSSDSDWCTTEVSQDNQLDTLVITAVTTLNDDAQRDAVVRVQVEDKYVEVNISQPVCVYYEIGDLFPNSQEPIGVVASTTHNGASGVVLALEEWTRGYSLLYEVWDAEILEAGSYEDGLANMGAAWANAKTGNYLNYPAFDYIHDMNPKGQVYSSGLYGVWYLPAAYEMTGIAEHIDKINQTLASVSDSDQISKTENYWCSTEIGKIDAFKINFSKDPIEFQSYKIDVCRVRAFIKY